MINGRYNCCYELDPPLLPVQTQWQPVAASHTLSQPGPQVEMLGLPPVPASTSCVGFEVPLQADTALINKSSQAFMRPSLPQAAANPEKFTPLGRQARHRARFRDAVTEMRQRPNS